MFLKQQSSLNIVPICVYPNSIIHSFLSHEREQCACPFCTVHTPTCHFFFSFSEKRVKCIYFSFLLFFLIISCLRNVQNTQTSPQTVAMRQCPCPAALPIQMKLCCGHKKASHFWLSPIEYFSFEGARVIKI